MSHRTIISLAASVVIGIASVSAVSTAAFAHRKGARVHHVAAAPAAAAPVILTNDYGQIADRVPRCIDSVIYYPYPPCY
jgi:cytochrome oxidase Cu insertion factor (SCO1/SenC/PrrC family)